MQSHGDTVMSRTFAALALLEPTPHFLLSWGVEVVAGAHVCP